jgi:hypothetical protein
MSKQSKIKVGHHVVVDDSLNFYHGREVLVTELRDGFVSVVYNGNVSFCLKNIHCKYMQYQD